jgi:hypothetical protein
MGLAVSMGVFGVSRRFPLVSLPLLRRVIHAPAPFFLNGPGRQTGSGMGSSIARKSAQVKRKRNPLTPFRAREKRRCTPLFVLP